MLTSIVLDVEQVEALQNVLVKARAHARLKAAVSTVMKEHWLGQSEVCTELLDVVNAAVGAEDVVGVTL